MPKDDGMGEKTEPATQKRREEAREKGQVAKSQDLTGALVMLLGFASLKVLGSWLGPEILSYFRWPLENLDGYEEGLQTHIAGWSSGVGGLLLILSPLLGILFVVAQLGLPTAVIYEHRRGACPAPRMMSISRRR